MVHKAMKCFKLRKDFLANDTFLHMFDENETRKEGVTVDFPTRLSEKYSI